MSVSDIVDLNQCNFGFYHHKFTYRVYSRAEVGLAQGRLKAGLLFPKRMRRRGLLGVGVWTVFNPIRGIG